MELCYETNENIARGNEAVIFNIYLKNGHLIFKTHTKNQILVSCNQLRKNTFEDIYNISFEDNILSISEKDANNLQNILSQIVSINIGKKKHIIEITIPEEMISEGKIQVVNGNIEGNFLKTQAAIKQTNGNLKLGLLKMQNGSYANVNGDIVIDKLIGSIEKISLVNGDIYILDGEIDYFNIKSVNGDIKIKGNFNLKKDCSIKNVAGNICIDAISFRGDQHINIAVTFGNITTSDKIPPEKLNISKIANFKSFSIKNVINPLIKNLSKSGKHKKYYQKAKVEVQKPLSHNDERQKNIDKILQMLADNKITYQQSQNLIDSL